MDKIKEARMHMKKALRDLLQLAEYDSSAITDEEILEAFTRYQDERFGYLFVKENEC